MNTNDIIYQFVLHKFTRY